jgi:hypothetical protein
MNAAFIVVAQYLAFVVLVMLVHGCARCTYTVVGVRGSSVLIVMNDCTGDVSLRNVPEDVHMDGTMAKRPPGE